MGPDTNDIDFYMSWYSWALLSQTPKPLKNLTLDHEFPTRDSMQAIFNSAGFEWAPGLLECIRSDTPPDLDFFRSLPSHAKTWAIYILVLEKDDHRCRVYTSSGTDPNLGVGRRTKTYDRRMKNEKSKDGIPYYVEDSLKEGFKITSKGLLGWTDIPQPSEVWSLRCLCLVIEATFSMCFWTMKSRDKGYSMPALCPWDRSAFSYDGLCTHFSINESIPGTHTHGTPEEINALAEERRVNKQAFYIANKGPGVHAANTKAYGEKALEEQRYHCDVCDLTFRSNAKLLEHQERQIHKDKAAGLVKKPQGRGGTQLAITKKKFWCEVCQHAASTAARLAIHLNGVRHKKKLRDIAAAQKLEIEALENQ